MFLNANLKGKLRNTNIHQNPLLFPLFGVILNPIHSIDKRIKLDQEFKILKSHIQVQSLNNKLSNWNELDISVFMKEINSTLKKSIGNKLSKLEEIEWMEVFETKRRRFNLYKLKLRKLIMILIRWFMSFMG